MQTSSELERSPFLGALFEGAVASEIVKAQGARGKNRELYYFRDQQGLEVDFMLPSSRGTLTLVECKASKNARIADAASMGRLADAIVKRSRGAVEQRVVHRGTAEATPLRPGASAIGWAAFSMALNHE